jgi:hypothetical protein
MSSLESWILASVLVTLAFFVTIRCEKLHDDMADEDVPLIHTSAAMATTSTSTYMRRRSQSSMLDEEEEVEEEPLSF